MQSLHKSFFGTPVLQGVDLEISPGELTVLIGPSGCGKSTFLRCLNGLERMDSGSVVIAGASLEATDRNFEQTSRAIRVRVGMVFQSFNLFPHLTVLENCIKAPQVVLKLKRAEAVERASQLLEKVGLDARMHFYPHQLSGGQQQRAAIARALAMDPQVMLYDEPTSALDPTLTHEVLQVMKRLDAEGMTQVVATHEMKFAKDVADSVVFFHRGSIRERGNSEAIFGAPVHAETREFLRHF